MLTPHDIEEYPLPKATLGGYKCEAVDSFLDTVAADYQKLYDENLTLTKKMNVLVEKIAEYRKDEEYLKTAMVEAQRIVETASREAKENAEAVMNDANLRSETMLKNVTRKAQEADKHYEQMRLEVNNFRNQLLNTYKSHIEIISALPVYEREEQDEAARAEAEKAAAKAAAKAAEEEAARQAEIQVEAVEQPGKHAVAEAEPVEAAAAEPVGKHAVAEAEPVEEAAAEPVGKHAAEEPAADTDDIAAAISGISAADIDGEDQGDFNTVNFDV